MEKVVGGSKTHERQKKKRRVLLQRIATGYPPEQNSSSIVITFFEFFHFDFLDKQMENLGISKKTMSRIWNYTCPNTAFLTDTKKLPHRFVIQKFRQNQTKLVVLQNHQTPLLNIPDGAVFLATLSPPPLPKIKYKKHIHISTRLKCTRHQHAVI